MTTSYREFSVAIDEVTDWRVLEELSAMKGRCNVADTALTNYVRMLAGRAVRVGNTKD